MPRCVRGGSSRPARGPGEPKRNPALIELEGKCRVLSRPKGARGQIMKYDSRFIEIARTGSHYRNSLTVLNDPRL